LGRRGARRFSHSFLLSSFIMAKTKAAAEFPYLETSVAGKYSWGEA
jgi:hypothetical protein